MRQIALVAERLAPVEEALCDVFGIRVCYRDPGVGHFGLENALFPIGNQLLEVVAPHVLAGLGVVARRVSVWETDEACAVASQSGGAAASPSARGEPPPVQAARKASSIAPRALWKAREMRIGMAGPL